MEKSVFGKDWIAGQDAQYISDQILENKSVDEADGYSIFNLTLSNGRLLNNRLSVSANIYNLLDEDYAHPASADHLQDVIDQDGRIYRVKLDYRF
jgi:iron complex outermembrane receptor protein